MKEMKTLTLNGKTYDSFPDKEARAEIEELKQNGLVPDSGQNGNNDVSVLMADMVLAETANAPEKLDIVTHASGGNQPIHPKVLYFQDGFGGHKFWMAYTPYPNGADLEENPCIAYSDDMVTWLTPNGVTNPLDVPADTGDNYLSDTHLVYNDDTKMLEIWYRGASSAETIYRRRSADGVTWGEREIMFRGSRGLTSYLSPVIIYEDGIYKIWAGSGNPSGYLKYYESADGTNWELKATTNLNGWHFDVIHTEEGYEAFISDTQPGASVSYSKSADGITWDDKIQLLSAGASGKWDASRLYRTCAVKINGVYYVYYTGVAADGTWGIGLTVSSIAGDVMSIRGYTDGRTIETTIFRQLQSLLFRINAIKNETSGDTGNEPGETVVLSSISAIYTGGSVPAGTAVSDLTGIVVTAHCSDGTSKTVTGYTLSGTIAEGNNTVTVSYGGKTTTFSVVGVTETGGEEEPDTPDGVVNSFADSTWEEGYWNPANGEMATALNMHHSKFIPITDIEGETINVMDYSSTASGNPILRVNYFDSSFTFLGYDAGSGYNIDKFVMPVQVCKPENAAYYAISANTTDKSAIVVTESSYKVPDGQRMAGLSWHYGSINGNTGAAITGTTDIITDAFNISDYVGAAITAEAEYGTQQSTKIVFFDSDDAFLSAIFDNKKVTGRVPSGAVTAKTGMRASSKQFALYLGGAVTAEMLLGESTVTEILD